ncbi:MAG: sulfotransferase [Methylococcales bacterium]|nr:sulfotransferase [Methylococcales bacterium]
MANNANPIFIVGAARSGTTFLQYMLRSHPEISLPTGESHFFIPFYQRRNEFGDLSDITRLRDLVKELYQFHPDFFDGDLHGIQFNAESITQRLHKLDIKSIPEVISGIFQINAEAEGKTRWGDKTPYYVLHLDTILEMFPNAQIVHLIRDGRDCALSMLERKWDLEIFNTYHSAYTWNKYVLAGESFGQKHPEHYYKIYYEDILNSPEKTLMDLCQFLNIEFNTQVINFNKSKSPGKTPLVSQPIQKANQDKWRQKMTPAQIRIFESQAGDTLRKCGYETIYTQPTINRFEWFINELHIKLCQFYSKHFKKNKR